jgi:hypothetical protein
VGYFCNFLIAAQSKQSSMSATVKSEAIACARRCRSSQLTGWCTRKKNNQKKWRAEEERHEGSQTKKNTKKTITHECNCEVRGLCKEMPVIPVDREVEKKRIIGKNGGPRRRGKNIKKQSPMR